jgi:hypothetical protein
MPEIETFITDEEAGLPVKDGPAFFVLQLFLVNQFERELNLP